MSRHVTKWSAIVLLSAATSTAALPASADLGQDGKPMAANKQVATEFRADPTAAVTRRGTSRDTMPEEIKSIFIGATGGLAYAAFKQSELAATSLVGPMISVQLGYRVSPRWAVSLVYTDFQRAVARGTSGELFTAATSMLHTQADCTKCTSWSAGGAPNNATFRLATLGPSVDVTPFGRSGPYLGASGGLAISAVTDTVYGGAGTARAGLRIRPIDAISLGVEGGVQGQVFPGGSARIGYGAAELRLGF
jgi:hypothetical protein